MKARSGIHHGAITRELSHAGTRTVGMMESPNGKHPKYNKESRSYHDAHSHHVPSKIVSKLACRCSWHWRSGSSMLDCLHIGVQRQPHAQACSWLGACTRIICSPTEWTLLEHRRECSVFFGTECIAMCMKQYRSNACLQVGTGGQVQVCLIVCTLVYRGSRTPKPVHGLVLVQEPFAAQQNGPCSNIEESAPFFLAQNVLQCV